MLENQEVVSPINRGRTLFSTLLEGETVQVKVHTQKTVQQRKKSPIKALHENQRRNSIFVQKGKVMNSQHLLALVDEDKMIEGSAATK